MKKKTLQKMLSVLVCAGMAASLLTGCGGSDSEGKSEESGEGKFAGQTLTVSVKTVESTLSGMNPSKMSLRKKPEQQSIWKEHLTKRFYQKRWQNPGIMMCLPWMVR